MNGVPRGGAYNSATVGYYRSGGRAREGNRRSDVREYIGFRLYMSVNGVMRCGSFGGWSNYSRSGFRLANRAKTYASSALGFR